MEKCKNEKCFPLVKQVAHGKLTDESQKAKQINDKTIIVNFSVHGHCLDHFLMKVSQTVCCENVKVGVLCQVVTCVHYTSFSLLAVYSCVVQICSWCVITNLVSKPILSIKMIR